jgi:hypothetical protein
MTYRYREQAKAYNGIRYALNSAHQLNPARLIVPIIGDFP